MKDVKLVLFPKLCILSAWIWNADRRTTWGVDDMKNNS